MELGFSNLFNTGFYHYNSHRASLRSKFWEGIPKEKIYQRKNPSQFRSSFDIDFTPEELNFDPIRYSISLCPFVAFGLSEKHRNLGIAQNGVFFNGNRWQENQLEIFRIRYLRFQLSETQLDQVQRFVPFKKKKPLGVN